MRCQSTQTPGDAGPRPRRSSWIGGDHPCSGKGVVHSPARHGEVCPDSRCRTHGRFAKPNFYSRALSIGSVLDVFSWNCIPSDRVHHDVASRGMTPVIIVDRRGKLPASQATMERKEHGSVQHETVGNLEVQPQQHMDQLAKNHSGWFATVDDWCLVILLCLCPLSLGVGVRHQLSGQAAPGRGGDSILLPGTVGRCPASHVELCVRQRHST